MELSSSKIKKFLVFQEMELARPKKKHNRKRKKVSYTFSYKEAKFFKLK